MISEKKWIKLWATMIILVPTVALFNYIIDPYGMNEKWMIDGINNYKQTNTGYTYRFKTNIVMDKEFDTLLLGTSRIGVMDPEVVDGYLKGKSFNFESPASTVEMQYKLFMYTLKHNNIKNLVYGIDFMTFNKSRTLEKTFPEFNELDEKIVAKERISNYDLYFNLETFKTSSTVLYKNLMNKKIVENRYLAKNGMRTYTEYQLNLKEGLYDSKRSINDSFREYYNNENGIYKNYEFSARYLDYFSKIIDECKKNDIKRWVYIPPMMSEHFDSLNSAGYFDDFEHFKRELAKITNYIDFTGHNSITTNKENYWDSSHLRVELTKPLMARVFNDLSHAPKDFGVLVTEDNIEEHLKNLRDQLESFDLNKTLKEF